MQNPETRPNRVDAGILEASRASWVNERAATLVRHALVLGLLASAAITVIQFVQRLLPDWEGEYLVVLAVLIGLEAMASTRALRNINWFEADWVFLRTAETVVILVTLRILIYALHGFGQLQADLAAWGYDILNYFNDAEFIGVTIFSFFIWSLANAFSRDLADQEGDHRIVDQETLRFALQDRDQARRRIVNRVFGLGMILVVVSAMTRADLGIFWVERPGFSGGGLNLLVYFVLGLVLFSLSQYATLRAFWSWDRIPVDSRLTVNWARFSLMFLMGLILLVGLLPTRFSIGFLSLMQRLIFYFLNLLSALVTAIWSIFLLLIYLLTRMVGFSEQPFTAPDRVLPEFTPPPPATLPSESSPLAWLDGLRIVLFWVIFLVAVFYSFDYFFRHYQDRLDWIKQFSWIQALRRFWIWMRQVFSAWRRSVGGTVLNSIDRLRSATLPRPARETGGLRVLNPLRRSPRQQVWFYYLAMIQRAAETGRPRKPGQTPNQFADLLEGSLPESAESVRDLTDAFSEARYSLHPVDKEQARQARSNWIRIQRAFRKAR